MLCNYIVNLTVLENSTFVYSDVGHTLVILAALGAK